MASHDNFGLWQHLRFLIPKRNWVKPSLFIAGFGKGVAERAKEWEEVGWRKLLLESVFSHPPNSPSFILVTSLMNTPKTTPLIIAPFLFHPLARLANGSRRRRGFLGDRASQIDFIHGRIHTGPVSAANARFACPPLPILPLRQRENERKTATAEGE